MSFSPRMVVLLGLLLLLFNPPSPAPEVYTPTSLGAADALPLALDDSYATEEDGVLSVEAPGVLGNDLAAALVGPVPTASDGTTAVALTDLTTGTYQGFEGGLYPGGLNTMPAAHDAAGLSRAQAITPLDLNGVPDPDGAVVMLTIGMSHTTQDTCKASYDTMEGCHPWTFIGRAEGDPSLHDQLRLVNGASGGRSIVAWDEDDDVGYTDLLRDKLTPAGLSEAQVQVVWGKLSHINSTDWPTLPDANANAFAFESHLAEVTRALKTRYPNLKQVFFSTRSYGGFAPATSASPEPYAYEHGFSLKWLIEAQINQMDSLGIDPENGDLDYNTVVPWIAWGPYLWADGPTPRSDGLFYDRSDYEVDGSHPSVTGEVKVGSLLVDFFKTSPHTRCWFTNEGVCGNRDLVALITDPPTNGTVDLFADGRFTYTPNPDFSGTDTFRYRVGDGVAYSDTATVTLTVAPSPDAPVSADDAYVFEGGLGRTFAAPGVLLNDVSLDGTAMTAVLETPPANGTLTLDATGGFSYTPDAGFEGTDVFTYRAANTTEVSPPATVLLTTTAAGIPASVCYLVADNDGAGEQDVLTWIEPTTGLETAIGATGTTLIEAIAFNPADSLLYATDGKYLGTIDLETGLFTEIGKAGFGDGPLGFLAFDDIDGLAFDPADGTLYGSVREVEEDYLIQIDPATGDARDDAFGIGQTYVVLEGLAALGEVHGLAFDPATGVLFAVVTQDQEGDSYLVTIDKQTGVVTQPLPLSGTQIESLAIDPATGTLIGSLGDGLKEVLSIDPVTGTTASFTPLGVEGNRDYEALDCQPVPPGAISLPPPPPADPLIDLELQIAVDQNAPAVGDTLRYTITLANRLPAATAEATEVAVQHLFKPGLTLLAATPDPGTTFSLNSRRWIIPALAPGDSLLLRLDALLTTDQQAIHCAQVRRASPQDVDSTPGNGPVLEDDMACSVVVPTSTPADAACYLVADNDGRGGQDVLLRLEKATQALTRIGPTGTTLLEAMAYDPFTGLLYAVDSPVLGRIDPATGTFTALGALGQGSGARGTRGFSDVDGLAVDPHTGRLYGTVRKTGEEDLLIQIDPTTGAARPEAFGPGRTYVVLDADDQHREVDDLAVDPLDGTLYAVVNADAGPSRLLQIDKATGALQASLALDVEDIEGLAFDSDGTLLGTRGGDHRDVRAIDPSTGETYLRAPLAAFEDRDYEALDCLTNPPNTLTLTVFTDRNGDGQQDAEEGGLADQPVTFYRDLDGDGRLGSADVALHQATTAADGTVPFRTAAHGAFLVALDDPALSAATAQPALFAGFGLTTAQALSATPATATATDSDDTLPTTVTLAPNYPNPFNPTTTIAFTLPQAAPVHLSVFDLLGRRVALLLDGPTPAGRHDVRFEASGLPSGPYFYRLETLGHVETRSMMLLK